MCGVPHKISVCLCRNLLGGEYTQPVGRALRQFAECLTQNVLSALKQMFVEYAKNTQYHVYLQEFAEWGVHTDGRRVDVGWTLLALSSLPASMT